MSDFIRKILQSSQTFLGNLFAWISKKIPPFRKFVFFTFIFCCAYVISAYLYTKPFFAYNTTYRIFDYDPPKGNAFLEVPFLIVILIGPDLKIEPPPIGDYFVPNDIINTYRTFAARKIAYFGPEAKFAIPALKQALKDRNLAVRYYAACALYKIGYKKQSQMDYLISEFGKVKSPKYLNALIDSFVIIDSESLPAISYIEKELLHPHYLVRRYADIAITEIAGPEYAIRANMANLKNKDPEIRSDALSNLSFIGSRFDIDVRQILYQAFNDDNPDVIYSACQDLLERHKEPPEKVLPGLIKAIDKGLASSSDSAVQRISQMGTKAKEALPVLYKFVGSEQDAYIFTTVETILKIGGLREEILKNLILRLQDDSVKNDERVIYALGKYGKESIPAIPILLERYKVEYNEKLADTRYPIHIDMITTRSGTALSEILKTIEEDTETEYSYLESLLKCGLQKIPEEASEAIKKKKIYFNDYVKSLSEMLMSENIETKKFAVQKLAKVGAAAVRYLPILQEYSEFDNPEYENKFKKYKLKDLEELSESADSAINSIARSIPAGTGIKPDVLLVCLKGKSQSRTDVLECYLRIGGDLKKAFRKLVSLIDHYGHRSFYTPLKIIADFKEQSYLALPMLANLNNYDQIANSSNSKEICVMIDAIKPDSKISSSDILKLMECTSSAIIEAAIQAALRKGVTYDDISVKLVEQYNGENPEVSSESSRVLSNLGSKAFAAAPLLLKIKERPHRFSESPEWIICAILKDIRLASLNMVDTSQQSSITVDDLLKFMKTDNRHIMSAAAEVVNELTGDFELTGVMLARLACSENEDISKTAFRVLWDFGFKSEAALPILREMPDRFRWTQERKEKLIKHIEEEINRGISYSSSN